MKLQKIIKNKYLYYAACALAAINLLGYISQGSMECILLFAVGTYAANHFTKNRTLDIFVGLFAANVLFGCGRIKEGMVEAATSNSTKIEKLSAEVAAESKNCPKKCGPMTGANKKKCLDECSKMLLKAKEKMKEAEEKTKTK